ncbi:hypothetical protein NCCP1664_14060 [Zafaria cholistanensis]|uniref:Uncharacterized protein n=1 Tax=Zafaria cholistanensis TaxID=1682741 RepID=A0A5A7NQC2_9MICC|nr:bifunctional hydroxymethylpyrimidine kinase/phosphomethylpyrimidine kinase [Zafaria cholistanensis]GER22909.1 hypothetical protein NCCP1664_14060 [Zafaria cholistanensis]
MSGRPGTGPEASGIPNVLSIAGSDPSGGAGIQADLKSIAACGGYGMAAITALTAQNTRGVTGVHTPPAAFLTEQLESVAADVRLDAVKIGMLANVEVIRAVGAWLEGLRAQASAAGCGDGGARPPAIVLDPVLVATSGDRLSGSGSVAALRRLLPLVDLATPNLPELAALCGRPVATDWAGALEQARELSAGYGVLVLAKGGHLAGKECPDALVGPEGVLLEVPGERVDTPNTHGTGCSLSSALATLFARTGDWARALVLAKAWLRGALEASGQLEVGGGHGPVHHFAALWSGAGVPREEASLDTWWNGIADLRESIDGLGFIRQLREGTLARADFEHYLAQDALYLQTYGRVLSQASALAPDLAAQRFWAQSAHGCMVSERTLHQGRLELADGALPAVVPSATTTGYLNHLQAAAASGSYPVLAAALLPCFWLYRDIGARLAAGNRPDHPYADWLAMYSSPEFDEATRQAIGWVQAAANTARPAELAAMRTAFRESSRWELEFFDQRPEAATRAAVPGPATAARGS